MSALTADSNVVNSCTSHDVLLPFQTATTPNSLVALAVLILIIHYTRSHFFHPILRGIGARLGNWSYGPKWVKQNEESIDNFSNFGFRFLFRLIVTGLGFLELWQSPEWWYNTSLLWEEYPHHFVSNTVQILYLLQLAYHLEDLGGVLIEGNSNRKDYTAMLIHHVVTALLLFGSTHLHATRIGTIVSTLHAVTDVPKDFAKVAKTLEWDLASKIGFGTLVLTWIVARMYLYPFVYVKSAFYETAPLLEGGMSAGTLRGFHILLSVLIMLNIMWFHMMLKLILKLIKGGKAEDPQLVKKQQTTVQLEASGDLGKGEWVVSSSSSEDGTASDVSVDSTAFSDSDSGVESISDDDCNPNEQ